MKKALRFLLVLVLSLALLTVLALADQAASVYVAVATEGEINLAWEPVYASDRDTDGIITISDALTCAHDQSYPGGAEAGYADEHTQYGISMIRLWGVENGGSYGYYLNGEMAMSLADPVTDGDLIYAFTYQDTVGFSDALSFFDYAIVYTSVDDTLDLTLISTGFDENWELTYAPCSGAEIYVQTPDSCPVFLDAKGTSDEEGSFSITFLQTGRFVITAKANDRVLTPPVCVVYVSEKVMSPADYAMQTLQGLYAQGMTNDSPFTRQNLVDTLYSLSGSPAIEGSSLFSDVDADNAAVIWASRAGLIQGYGDGSFGGSDALTRQQLAVVAERYFTVVLGMDLSALGDGDLSAYADAADVAPWAQEAVGHMAALGFVSGDALYPENPLTLGQAVELLSPVLSLMA